jgi:hypothetical protein
VTEVTVPAPPGLEVVVVYSIPPAVVTGRKAASNRKRARAALSMGLSMRLRWRGRSPRKRSLRIVVARADGAGIVMQVEALMSDSFG